MKIGNVELKNNLISAPMAGITDLPFRLMAVEEGCGLVVTEMVSAKGLIMGGKKSFSLLESSLTEKPVAVQLFGSEPETVAEAAAIVEGAGADVVDVNMGCPVAKIVKNGSGSALLKDLAVIEKMLSLVRKMIEAPITIKIRSGWDASSIVAGEVLKIAENSGVDAVTLHGRTKSQGFGGRSDWSLIRDLKAGAKIPVIGNGDIKSPHDVLKMLNTTGCDGVMIGRAAIGNPWIFRQSLSLLKYGTFDDISIEEKRDKAIRHCDLITARYGQEKGIRIFRKHLAAYSKGISGAAAFRQLINKTVSADKINELVRSFFSIQNSEAPHYYQNNEAAA